MVRLGGGEVILFKQCGIMIAKIMLSVFYVVMCRLKIKSSAEKPRVKKREEGLRFPSNI